MALANECDFGLGSNAWQQALSQGLPAQRGMTTINDFCATYMALLPFGGVKESGFDVSGIEGLRGCCNVKSVVVDGDPGSARTFPAAAVPAALRVPVLQGAVPHVLRGTRENARGLFMLVSAMMIHAEGAPEGWHDDANYLHTYDFN